jgi:hypothetical protein
MHANVLRHLSLTTQTTRAPAASVIFVQTRAFRQNENFTFDWKKVPASLEKEREKFDSYNDVVGDARFSPQPVNMREVAYVATRDPVEWRFVQRLVDACKPKPVPGMGSCLFEIYFGVRMMHERQFFGSALFSEVDPDPAMPAKCKPKPVPGMGS